MKPSTRKKIATRRPDIDSSVGPAEGLIFSTRTDTFVKVGAVLLGVLGYFCDISTQNSPNITARYLGPKYVEVEAIIPPDYKTYPPVTVES